MISILFVVIAFVEQSVSLSVAIENRVVNAGAKL